MAAFTTSYFYILDENGNSTTGKVDQQVPNGDATVIESIDDNTISVGETFTVDFTDPSTNLLYPTEYIYRGHVDQGAVASPVEAPNEYYMFSNQVVAEGTTLNQFVAEDIEFTDSGPVCFAEGTLVLTPAGEVPVETLRAGDLVVVPLGTPRVQPLRWVGHRRVEVAGARDRRMVAPVLVRAGALAPGVPIRDMRVSPEHAFLLEGRLVPARLLVDGASIIQQSWTRAVTYWHLELEQHGILVADGALAESYFDDGNRTFFENAALVPLHPLFARRPNSRYAEDACAPPILSAEDPALATILARIRAAGRRVA